MEKGREENRLSKYSTNNYALSLQQNCLDKKVFGCCCNTTQTKPSTIHLWCFHKKRFAQNTNLSYSCNMLPKPTEGTTTIFFEHATQITTLKYIVLQISKSTNYCSYITYKLCLNPKTSGLLFYSWKNGEELQHIVDTIRSTF